MRHVGLPLAPEKSPRHLLRLASALAILALLVGGSQTTVFARAAAHRPGGRVAIHLSLVGRNFLSIVGTVKPAPGYERAAVQIRRGKRWSTAGKAARVSKKGAFTARINVPPGASSITVRILASGSAGKLTGPATALQIGSKGSAAFSVPATTRIYAGSAVQSASAGPGGTTIVNLAPGSAKPVVGGHAALGPSAALPFGMFASVISASSHRGGWTASLRSAPIDQVLENVSTHFDQDVTPELVGADGSAADSGPRRRALRIAGPAAFASSAAGSAFQCKGAGGSQSADSAFSSVRPMPLSIELTHMHALDDFDLGSVYPRRDPFLLMQITGQAKAEIGFEAKNAFTCKLSDTFRESHRIAVPLGAVGPVPVTMYLEPTLEFSVSESGSVSLSQQNYFGITLEQNGFAPFKARLSHSADPVQVNANAALGASLFAGGDLSVMFGASEGDIAAQAGIYGAFGPDFELKASTSRPGCIGATAKLEADLGVRLQLLTKRWSAQLASLTSSPVDLGGPWCVGTGGSTGGKGGGGSAGSGGAGSGGSPSNPLPPGGTDAGSALYRSSGIIDSVSCPAVGHCMAMEDTYPEEASYALSEAEGWGRTRLPEPADGQNGRVTFDGMHCFSGGSICIAPGDYAESTDRNREHTFPVIDVKRAGPWEMIEPPEPPTPAPGETPHFLDDIAMECASSTFCFVLEQYQLPQAGDRTAALILENGAWRTEWLPAQMPTTYGTEGYDVSCPAVGHCVVTGWEDERIEDDVYRGSGFFDYDDGSWSFEEAPMTAAAMGRGGISPDEIECRQVGDCVANGDSEGAFDEHFGEIFSQTGGGPWTVTDAPVPPDNQNAYTGPMSCYAVGKCYFGYYLEGGDYGPPQDPSLGVFEASGGWQGSAPIAFPDGARFGDSYVTELQCFAETCHGIGQYAIESGGEVEDRFGLLEGTPSNPSVSEVSIDGEVPGEIGSGSCANATDCVYSARLEHEWVLFRPSG